MIKKGFYMQDLPPFHSVAMVAAHSPNICYLYIKLWLSKDQNYEVESPKYKTKERFCFSYGVFRCLLNELSDLGLLRYRENVTEVIVYLTKPEIKADGKLLS